jgi:SSS family solute:Na+ symporter
MLAQVPAAPAAPAAGGSTFAGVDWLMIGLYFCVLLGVVWYVVKRRADTATDYFLAGRNLGWWIIGASIFASNIGSEHIVGLAGSGATNGVALAHYELHAWCLLMLAWVFVPFYARSLVFTMPEFLERRFSVGSRYVLSVVSIVTFVVTKIAVGIFAGGTVFAALLPEMQIHVGGHLIDSFWIGSVAVILLTGLYTMVGGMRAVAYNDAVQVTVLITGSGCLTFYGLHMLGGGQGIFHGWSELRRLCGSDMFNLWKPMVPHGVAASWSPVLEKDTAGNITREAWYFNGNFPWLGMAICAPVIGLWYWCTDQYIVQRALGAPDERVARQGSIFAAFLKLFPVYLFIIPGLIYYALVKANTVPALSADYDPQAAFPLMVKHLLPAGLRGLVVAGLLSALMGSLAGVFNACSTLFTVDLYQKWKPKASQHQLVFTGRMATFIMVIIALLWIPVVQGNSSLYGYLQSVQGYLAPPVFVVFFFGVFWKRLNAQGAFWAMMVGFVVGFFRMLVDTPVSLGMFGYEDAAHKIAKGYSEGSFLWMINNINFQYFSILITLISGAVMIGVSLMTAAPDYEKIKNLSFGTKTAEDKQSTLHSWGWQEVAASVFVLVAILGAYLYFRG